MKQFRSMNAYLDNNNNDFYSYNSHIIRMDSNKRIIYLGIDFDYSTTTSKQVRYYFRDIWDMNIGVADLRKALKDDSELYGYTVKMMGGKL